METILHQGIGTSVCVVDRNHYGFCLDGKIEKRWLSKAISCMRGRRGLPEHLLGGFGVFGGEGVRSMIRIFDKNSSSPTMSGCTW
jgi:hypothetical protein